MNKTLLALTGSVALMANAALAGGVGPAKPDAIIVAPPPIVEAPAGSFGVGSLGAGAIIGGVLGVAALAAILSDDDDGSSSTGTTN